MKDCPKCHAYTETEHKTLADCLRHSRGKYFSYLESDATEYKKRQAMRLSDEEAEQARIIQAWQEEQST